MNSRNLGLSERRGFRLHKRLRVSVYFDLVAFKNTFRFGVSTDLVGKKVEFHQKKELKNGGTSNAYSNHKPATFGYAGLE